MSSFAANVLFEKQLVHLQDACRRWNASSPPCSRLSASVQGCPRASTPTPRIWRAARSLGSGARGRSRAYRRSGHLRPRSPSRARGSARVRRHAGRRAPASHPAAARGSAGRRSRSPHDGGTRARSMKSPPPRSGSTRPSRPSRTGSPISRRVAEGRPGKRRRPCPETSRHLVGYEDRDNLGRYAAAGRTTRARRSSTGVARARRQRWERARQPWVSAQRQRFARARTGRRPRAGRRCSRSVLFGAPSPELRRMAEAVPSMCSYATSTTSSGRKGSQGRTVPREGMGCQGTCIVNATA